MGSLPSGISGSRAAAILGLSEYSTAFTVWQQICEERRPGFGSSRGYLPVPPVDNAAVRWGSAFETAVVELASAARGEAIIEQEAFWTVNGFGDEPFFERGHGDRESGHIPNYITCHVDGMYNHPGYLRLHEGKTTSMMNFRESWGEPGSDRIPSGYQVQVQHQMLCTGAAECIVSVLVFPRRVDEWEAMGWAPMPVPEGYREGYCGKYMLFKYLRDESNPEKIASEESSPVYWASVLAEMGLFHQYTVPARPTLQRELVERYRHFWHTYVLPEREPPIDCYADLKRAFCAPKGTVVADEQIERWASEWKQIGDEIGDSGRLSRRREELKVLMINYMRSQDSTLDDESREKTVLRDRKGAKLAQFNGKVFR